MTKSTEESIQANITEWLDPGELLKEFTVGDIQGGGFDTIIALTSSNVRLGSAAGGRTFPLSDVRSIQWSGLWARLNIATESPSKRLVCSINGKQWKRRAANLAQVWKDSQPSR